MKKTIFKTFFLFLIASIFCISIGYSQNNTNYPDYKQNIEASIKYYNKQIFTLGKPLVIEVQIVNNDKDPFLFISSYNKIFTFDFEIYHSTNRPVEHSQFYIIKRNQFEPVLNDEITLKKNEVYGVRIDISEWFDFQEPGEYVIKGVFYPNLITDLKNKVYSANELFLNLRPAFPEEVLRREEIEELKKIKAESLPPYEVVNFFLKTLMQPEPDFEKYFLYINFEKFILQFSNARKKYEEAKDIDKPKIIEEFKQYLKGENVLEGIPFKEHIPNDFEIEEASIKKSDAQVIVIETFKYINLFEKKRYTYHFHLYGDKWLLEKYEVVNIGR